MLFRFDGTLCYPTKIIDGISTGIAKRLKRICPNDNNFLEQSKKYSAYLVAHNHKPKEIIRAFEKINNQPRSTVLHKRTKGNIKPVIFTTQYNPSDPNINSIIKKSIINLLLNSIIKKVITDNPSLIEMFLSDSTFCAYKWFPNLKNLMACADPHNMKPLKEVAQDPG